MTNNMDKEITVYPQGGLCNKLRVTLSYFKYAQTINKQLIVICVQLLIHQHI